LFPGILSHEKSKAIALYTSVWEFVLEILPVTNFYEEHDDLQNLNCIQDAKFFEKMLLVPFAGCEEIAKNAEAMIASNPKENDTPYFFDDQM